MTKALDAQHSTFEKAKKELITAATRATKALDREKKKLTRQVKTSSNRAKKAAEKNA